VPTPREARVPTAGHEVYRPRPDEAFRVARAAPPTRTTGAPDAAEVRPRTSRHDRTRVVALAVAAVLIVAAAAVAVILLMG
jgi:hypothetical protein